MHNDRTPERHGATFAQTNRQEVKRRIQEKQIRLRDAARRARMSEVRLSGDADPWNTSAAGLSTPDTTPQGLATSGYRPSAVCRDDEEMGHLDAHDWSTIAREFGYDLSDPCTMDWLLALEEEIRQEALFAFFDATHATEEQWADYYQSLASH